MSYLLFAACAGLATYMQGLTGFAFALVLLGSSSLLHLAALPDAANAATVLLLLNAAVHFRLHPLTPQWRVVRPALPSSLLCVVLGVWMLGWLSTNSVQGLRSLLGLTIIACAVLLLFTGRERARASGSLAYAFAGGLSGLLGGLFSAPGPPLVFHMYRQPLEREVIRQCLLLTFASNAVLRLALVLAGGQFSRESLLLSACAAPAVYAVNRLQHRFPPRLNSQHVRRLVAALLVLTGAALAAPSSLR
jgi:uncharacterized protein